MTQSTALLLLTTLLLAGCNTDNRIQQTAALKQEMNAAEIKRVTNPQLIATVDEWGKELVAEARKALEKELGRNPQQATALCQDSQKVPLIAAMDRAYGVKIQLMGPADVKNQSLAPKERELLDAYLYNAENNLPQSDNVQKLNDTLLLYTAPVPLESLICKTCFKDQQVTFAVWRVLFDRKAVIRKMNAK
ncbi:hypothetical protein GBK04_16600 [Cytophagaceae bacterium SJW1-29]|uniref:Uncharacterized protein n=2 Tax=Salmonirosea aquatica TaxID=2654236 RepID=A0A7C9FZI8_9BACT|nr:hypothetical protein [Cytophagaceae bacterium SJW1-29]